MISPRELTVRALERVTEALAVGLTWIALSWWLRRAERPLRRR
jgi:hypothetical protein